MSVAVEVAITDVVIPEERARALGDIRALAESISKIGLLQPIVVTEDLRLVSGLHRLEAFRSLEIPTIPARVVKLDKLRAELAEIDENLIRNELTVLERGEHLARRKEIYEALNPEAPRGAGRPKKNGETISSFSEDAADKAGVSPRTVQHEIQISKKLTTEAKEIIRNSPVADSKSDLIGLARLEAEEQLAAARRLVEGHAKNVHQAVRQIEEERRASVPVPEIASARVLHGDVREILTDWHVGDTPQCVVMDPPYGLSTHNTRRGGKDYADGEGYALELLDLVCERLEEMLDPSAHLYVFSGYTYAHAFKEVLRQHFTVQDNPIIWVKSNHTMCDFSSWYPNRHEYIWFCKSKGSARKLASCVPDVIEAAHARDSTHSAEKPVELIRTLIENSTVPGELVLDPFAGSGASAVACMEAKRRFVGIELEERWVNVARARIANV